MGKLTHETSEAMEEDGYRVHLWFAEDFPGIAKWGKWGLFINPLLVARRLIQQRTNHDVVLLHEPTGFWYALARRLIRSLPPMICVSHGIENRNFRFHLMATDRGLARVSSKTRYTYWLTRAWQSYGALKMADAVISYSTPDGAYLTTRLNRRPGTVAIVANGVKPATSGSRGNGRTNQSILFVGGWLDNKGRYVLARIWNEIGRRYPQATLTLVGTGIGAERILPAFADEVVSRVSIIPRLESESRMQQQYGSHAIFLMPSLSEGSPLSLLEAMSNKCAVVATTVGGIPDIVEHGTSALLFHPFDVTDGVRHVSYLLDNPIEARRIAENASLVAAGFTWSKTAKGFEHLIEQVLLEERL